jgi:hypothetical protein
MDQCSNRPRRLLTHSILLTPFAYKVVLLYQLFAWRRKDMPAQKKTISFVPPFLQADTKDIALTV